MFDIAIFENPKKFSALAKKQNTHKLVEWVRDTWRVAYTGNRIARELYTLMGGDNFIVSRPTCRRRVGESWVKFAKRVEWEFYGAYVYAREFLEKNRRYLHTDPNSLSGEHFWRARTAHTWANDMRYIIEVFWRQEIDWVEFVILMWGGEKAKKKLS